MDTRSQRCQTLQNGGRFRNILSATLLGICLTTLRLGAHFANVHGQTREMMYHVALGDTDTPVAIQTQHGRNAKETTPQQLAPVVDILSIGSKRRLELLKAQQQSFGSHISVRHFFNATEDDDADPHCEETLSEDNVFEVGKFCKRKPWDPEAQSFMRHMKNRFANIAWLKRKENAPGWMCAQRRPVHGLYKALQFFRTNDERNSNNNLPDYLILMDDDTYYNIDAALEDLVQDTTPDIPLVTAGCLVREPIHEFNFTFGFGGFGIIFNKASLEYMMKPIQCPKDTALCARIQENQLGEAAVFKDGMSLVGLMEAHAENEPYRTVANWTNGYCLHSDWTIGYYVNYYQISRHTVKDHHYDDVPQSRIEIWRDSELYRSPKGFCQNSEAEHCQPDSVACHYITANAMVNYTGVLKRKSPEKFVRDATALSVAR